MKKIIRENNTVGYGVYDNEEIDYNYNSFVVRNFFNKKVSKIKQKNLYHQFNYIGLISDDHLIGIAMVDLGYARQVFTFLYDMKTGIEYDKAKFIFTKSSKRYQFDRNPDENHAKFIKGKRTVLRIDKSHKSKELSFELDFKDLKINCEADYSFDNNPLRVLNPNDMNRWTFTEKSGNINVKKLSVEFNNQILKMDESNTRLIYDWSGGFLNRRTDWLWTAFSGKDINGEEIGVNFASFVNNVYYPENASWIGKSRERYPNIIYDLDLSNPYEKEWKIFTEDKRVELSFKPFGERNDKKNILGWTKLWFRQFIGEFNGAITDKKGNKHIIKGIKGFCEIHKSKW